MFPRFSVRWFTLLAILAGLFNPASLAQAAPPLARPAQSSGVTAYDLILAMNQLRTSNGLPALVEDPIINAVAQSTADIMAANQMSSHIGDVRGRLAAAGYGGGATVWATENFAVGNQSIDEIMVVWSDASHMLPAVNPAYCNVGAGVSKSENGRTYFVLQAAYVAGAACGEYKSSAGTTNSPGGSSGASGVPGIIIPVKVATPDQNGEIYHEVKAGQSFWAIAIAYQITIKDLETWNNISRDSKLQVGQRLFVPGKNTKGYSTPTPVGMIQTSTPDADGKVIHTVQAYQTLTTIAEAYKVKIDDILALNGIQMDWPLQIGQTLVIDPGNVTPTPTARPLTPIEKLTPASDGKYYHTVQSGETPLWIAGLYDVSVNDLLAWNGLDTHSFIQVDQELILQVTPPATETPTPEAATVTPTATTILPSPIPSRTPVSLTLSPTPVAVSSASTAGTTALWFLSIGLAIGGLFLAVSFSHKKR